MSVRQQMNTFFASLMEQTGVGQQGQIVNTPMGPFTFNPLTQTWTNVNNGMKMSAMEFQFSMYGMDYSTTTSDSGTTQAAWTPYVPPLPALTFINFDFTNASGSCLSPYITYERTGLAYSSLSNGRLQLVTADTPKYFQDVAYTPDSTLPINGRIGGVLLEPRRTNYVFQSPYVNPTYGTTFGVDAWTYSATGPAFMPVEGYTLDSGLHGLILGPDGVTNAYYMGVTCSLEPTKQPALISADGDYLYTDQDVFGYQSLRYKTGGYLDTRNPITVSFYIGCGYPNNVQELFGDAGSETRLVAELNAGAGFGIGSDSNTLKVGIRNEGGNLVSTTSVLQAGAYNYNLHSNQADMIYVNSTTSIPDGNSYKNWQRIQITFWRTSAVAGANVNQSVELKLRMNPAHICTMRGTYGYFAIWGLQIEQGNFATSLIPTANAPGVRGADVLKISDASQAIQGTLNTAFISTRRFGAEPTNLTGLTFSDVVKFYQTEGTSGATFLSIGNYLPNRGNTILGVGNQNRFILPMYVREYRNNVNTNTLYARQSLNSGGTYQAVNQLSLYGNNAMIRYNLNDYSLTSGNIFAGNAGLTGIGSFILSGGNTINQINNIAFNPDQVNSVGIKRFIWFKGSTGDVEMTEGPDTFTPAYVLNPPTSL